MDSSERRTTRRPPLVNHHHHHHHDLQPQFISLNSYYHIHFSAHCPVHSRFIQPPLHHPSCPHFLSPPPPLMTQDKDEAVLEEENEEESVFVLTDEWRNFFAKSEAKRKAVKKQAKKKGKQ